MPPETKPHLPAANEFSPGQVELKAVLEIVDRNAGDRKAIVEELRTTYFSGSAGKQSDSAKRRKVQNTRASNVLIGMKGYGLFDAGASDLTSVGRALLAASDETDLFDQFAAHILTDCHGLEVLEATQSLQSRGIRVSKATLHGELEARGFVLPRATTHHLKLLNWLRKAEVLDDQNQVSEDVVERLTGTTLGARDEWAAMTAAQRALLTTLRRLYEGRRDPSVPASELIDAAKLEYGSIFEEDQLAKKVFDPLQAAGWILRDTGQTGRGGKSGKIAPTEKLLATELDVMPDGDEWGVPHDLRPKLDTPLETIERELQSESKNVKGVALELLALRISADLSLVPLRFRLRADATGGAEVDLVAEAIHLSFARWLFQCKNTKSVPLSDLAKEIGVAEVLRANVVVMVTTGRFTSTVEAFAREYMTHSRVQVVLIDGSDLKDYLARGPAPLLEKFRLASREAMKYRRGQLDAGPKAPKLNSE